MRKEISAGAKAGMVSGLPLALSFDVFSTFVIGHALVTRFHSYTLLPNGMMLPIILVVIAVVYLALACLIGAMAGLVFVLIVDKFPIRSTYVKAIIPSVIVWWLLFRLLSYSWRGFVTLFALAILAFVLADSIIFAFLFNRWAKGVSLRRSLDSVRGLRLRSVR